MKVAFQMDPITKVDPKADSTLLSLSSVFVKDLSNKS